MIGHTIILEAQKNIIPESGVLDFVKNLINEGKTKIDYFGLEIDNQADYVDEAMQAKMDATTYITINFESEDEIDYEVLSEAENLRFVIDLLHTPQMELHSDGKDVTINI